MSHKTKTVDFVASKEFVFDVKGSVDGFNLDTTVTTVYSGNSYRYYFSVNNNYYTLAKKDIDVRVSNSSVLEIVDVVVYGSGNGGYVEVRAKKGGTSNLVFDARLIRTSGGDVKAETTSISIRSVNTDTGSKDTIKIVLLCVFGVCALGGLAYAIYSIVKHNKMGVK